MSELEIILEYKGEMAFETIDLLLKRLKELPEYKAIRRSLQKKVYCIFVECMENIYKHKITDSLCVNGKEISPYINLACQDENFNVSGGNVVTNDSIQSLKHNLDQINQQDRTGLKTLYADLINKELISDEDGAGLGLITIALNTEHKIKYNFSYLNDQFSYFEMNIPI